MLIKIPRTSHITKHLKIRIIINTLPREEQMAGADFCLTNKFILHLECRNSRVWMPYSCFRSKHHQNFKSVRKKFYLVFGI